MSSRFEQTSSETIHEGKFITVERRTYRHEDGDEVTREIVTHPGAVGVVSGVAVGAPNSAISPSPMYLSSVPPCLKMISDIAVK